LFGDAAGADAFNVDRIDAAEKTAAEIVDAANQLPILARARLVIVERAELLLKGPRAQPDPLISYLSNPAPSTCLVLLGEKPDARLRLAKAMAEAGVICEMTSPRDQELAGWLEGEARRLGKGISREAVEKLMSFSGNELSAAAGELEKLVLYVGKKREIESVDVEEAVADRAGAVVWAFTDALKARNAERALHALSRYLSGFRRVEEALFPLMGMLRSELRLLLHAKEIGERKRLRGAALANSLSRELKIHRLRAEKAATAAGRFSRSELLSAIEDLLRTDRQLKMSRLPPRIRLEAWVWRFCATRKGRGEQWSVPASRLAQPPGP
jgi:DNA polymerase-3 subunit delta